MVEVFITDLKNNIQADKILNAFRSEYNGMNISFDFDETNLPFPCGHTVLRVEGDAINSMKIISLVTSLGFKCKILVDKICIKNLIL